MANNNTELKGWAKYCKEQNIEFSTKRIFIDGLGGMAHGLFASLLIGCIINTIGMYVPLLKDIVVNPWGSEALAGANLLIASKTAAYAVQGATLAVGFAANALGAQGGPLAVFFVVVIAVFAGKLVSKRTPIDIIVTPFVTIVVGVLFAFLIAPPIGKGAVLLGDLVMKATALQPFWMGILVSALMGIILTLPISSAAICAGLGLVGLAGGACVAGCSAHMVGFAVASYRENGVQGLLSQGLGTSMLQVPNLVKKPSPALNWIGLVVCSFVIPALVSWLVSELMRKKGLIKEGDYALDL